MGKIKSYFMETEVFETSDGEVFVDDGAAEEHQGILDQHESLSGWFGVSEGETKKLIVSHAEYIIEVLKDSGKIKR